MPTGQAGGWLEAGKNGPRLGGGLSQMAGKRGEGEEFVSFCI